MTTPLKCLAQIFLMSALAAGCSRMESPPASGPAATGDSPAGSTTPGSATAPAAVEAPAPAPAAPPPPTLREVLVPEGTSITLTMETSVASDTSKVEDPVRATVAKPVVVSGITAIPEGAQVSGSVLDAKGSGRVKGRGEFTIQFNRLVAHSETMDIHATRITRQAASDKKDDAKKIGIGAGAGAIIGGIAGGGKGAAIGAVVGGGAGTGVAMSQRGDEAELAAGATVTIKLQQPLKVMVPE